jgi:anhydro-N-acetylmuramic acid kinase
MPRFIIGVAPGTSLQGVAAVLVEIHGAGTELTVRLVHVFHQAYPRDLRNLILKLNTGTPVEVKHLSLLHRLLGEIGALAARGVVDGASFSLQQVLCAGCAGHPIWHEPEGRYLSLLEVGMPAVIAERTGLTTVSDFRTRDIAAGGLGSPAEALADYLLFRDANENRAVVHLGGTASVVYIPARGREADVVGFEAGPCNLLLDALVRHASGGREAADPGGRYAVQGRCIEPLLESWLDHPYWQRRPPKALAPGAFGEAFVAQAIRLARQSEHDRNDLLCTATHLIARVVTLAIKRLAPEGRLPERILLSGGGVRNGFLWQLLDQELQPCVLAKTDSVGVPANCRRALAHGMLAALTLDGVPGNVPTATGAAGSRLIGSLTPGSGTNWARCVAWMAQQPMMSYRLTG